MSSHTSSPPSNIERRAEPEEALFNEAYLAVLIALTAANYNAKSGGRPMPWVLAFIAVPLVIHEFVRARLPKRTAAHFSKWIASEPIVHATFPDRAAALVPYIRRGLRYAIRSDLVSFDGSGLTSRLPANRDSKLKSEEARRAGHSAAFLGRWFAVIEDVPTIFGQLGVTP